MRDNQDEFNVLRYLYKKPNSSQRELAQNWVQFEKLNYCIKTLKEKGLVKIENFKKKNNKMKYIQYVITPKGISERTKLTLNFMKRKMEEYDILKKELHHVDGNKAES